ncbi:MAG: tRNA lysidine(34) synthetase TilS [Proteobacteria bacterium]|nr:tRNA lysidine(34) synthetase TilS [Pseudomonadota bacterium]MDA1058956.1 tRNA lysidine(34) synthetase TilS [Pseudomonadota bacterium]
MAARLASTDVWSDLRERFDATMGAYAPYENGPHLAVALSGGADSTALAILASDWAKERSGTVTGLIVDHGLRAESNEEAQLVQRRLAGLGLSARILEWRGPKPTTGIQAAARAARYQLLSDWCHHNGVLHLLAGHHADDQAETVTMRAARQSGADGLAGMSAVVEWQHCRLLRPLLAIAGDDLRAALVTAGVPWIEDPSNADLRFERARLRQSGAPSAANALPNRTRRAGVVRQRNEQRVRAALARAVHLHPFGFCEVDLAALDHETTAAALAHVVAWVGGRPYLPRPAAAQRLGTRLLDLAPGRAATLSGCEIRRRRSSLVIVREPSRHAPPQPIMPGSGFLWDLRFWVEMRANADSVDGAQVQALGKSGLDCVATGLGRDQLNGVPMAALAGLPALWRGKEVLSIPALAYQSRPHLGFSAIFRPQRKLLSSPFAVA